MGFLGYTAGVTSQFVRNPLVISRDGEVLRSVVRNRVDVTTHGAIGVWHFVDVGFDVPFVAHLDGQSPDDASVAGPNMGDTRVWVRARALDERRFGVSLLGHLAVGLPTGDADQWSGWGAATMDADLVVGRRLGIVTVAGAVGYRLLPTRRVLEDELDDQLTFSVAASLHREREGVEVQVRVFGATAAFSPFDSIETTNLEAVGALIWRPLAGLRIGGGIGAGLLSGPGTPAYRAFASVGWAAPIAPAPVVASVEPLPSPPVDSDGDGLFDSDDRCPDDPEDFDGFEDHDGCREPETLNGTADEDGCKDESLVKLDKERGRIEILNRAMVHFDWNNSDVPEAYLQVLKQVVYVLKTNPEIRLQVEGHTSWTGSHDYNMELSRLMHFGIEGERLSPKGFGFTRLKVRGKGPEINRVNRRVEFVILDGLD